MNQPETDSSHNIPQTNGITDQNTSKTPPEEFVRQTFVRQTLKPLKTETPLSLQDGRDALEETHSDFINIPALLGKIQKNYGKRKDSLIYIRVDKDTKLAWDVIVGGDRNTLETIVRPMLISILQSAAIYKGLIKETPIREDRYWVFQPQVNVNISMPEQNKEEENSDQFGTKFKEFLKFLNEVVFSSNNLVNNGYPVTKGVKNGIMKYIDELLSEEAEAKQKELLLEMRQFLETYTLNDKNFKDGVTKIPQVVYKEILQKLTKIEKLVN